MELIERKDVKLEDTWCVEDIFKTENDWLIAYQKIENEINELVKYQDKLNDANNLSDFLIKQEECFKLFSEVYGYAHLLSDQDTTNAHNIELKSKAINLYVQINTALSFANVEIMKISDQELKTYYLKEGLKRYQRFLNDLRRSKEHILSEKEEIVLASAKQMSNAEEIYSTFIDADMKFSDIIYHDKVIKLTSGNFIPLMQNQDRKLRELTFKTFYQSFKDNQNTLAKMLEAQNKELKFSSEMRKFNSPLSASLFESNVNEDVYHNLIETVHQRIDVLHKYMKLRKELLKVDQLHLYDLYVPMISDFDYNVSIDEAKKNVLNSIKVYGSDYEKVVETAFNYRWLDLYENKGKRSGAYSSGQTVHPYVLLNFKGTLDSEFTIAHEMGHALHSYYSNKYQNFIDRDYEIFVAEVASTTNEALLMDYLRNNTNDKKLLAYLINYFLEQFRTTLFRQTMFAEFELKISELVCNNEALTSSILNKIYRELNEFYYGSDLFIDEEISYEWARIPHFYYDFYVYQYATGFSAAMALSKKILSGKKQDIDNYLNFLKGGCSKPPLELLKGAGVDMSSSEPIEEAIDLFDSLINQMKEITK